MHMCMRRRRGQQRLRWLDSIIDSMDMKWRKLWEMVKDKEARRTAVPGAAKSWIRLSYWTTKDTDWETTGMGMHGGGFRGLQFSQPPVHSWPFLPPLPASSSLSDYVLRVRSENTAVFSQRPLVILGEGTRLSACSVPTPYCFLISWALYLKSECSTFQERRDIYKVKSSKRFPHQKISRTVLSYIAKAWICVKKGIIRAYWSWRKEHHFDQGKFGCTKQWLWMQWC